MKTKQLWIASILILTMLLSACSLPINETEGTQPPTSPDETSEPYPVGETDEPDQAYPTDEIPTQPSTGEVMGGSEYISDPTASPDDLEDHAENINEFALDLYRKLAQQDGNLIYSPYSIYQAFLMVYAGANAETRAEIAEVLDIDTDEDKDVHNLMNALNVLLTTPPENLDEDAQPLEFNVANALWVQRDIEFEQDFLDALSANYNAGLKLVDFSNSEEARQAINLWIAAQTNDKIKDLIPEGVLDELTRLVIANAVYFKGAWQHRFDPANTADETFYALDGTEQTVEMMSNSYTGAALVFDDYQAVKLPYQGGNYAMAAIMPTGDFSIFEETLDEDKIEDILKEFEGIFGQVDLRMPKFEIESSFDLGEQLKALGMIQAFDSQLADLTGMSDEIDLYITDVLHKAYIDVNEEGTEAAAATVVSVGTTSMPADSWEITLDHPFIYVIYETTSNTIVFMGRFVAP
ncbi:MAG: serpin family protein [Anaerolineaceae bacterium]|nr:serpin family protein [Anaerolineaceae bacterium]